MCGTCVYMYMYMYIGFKVHISSPSPLVYCIYMYSVHMYVAMCTRGIAYMYLVYSAMTEHIYTVYIPHVRCLRFM